MTTSVTAIPPAPSALAREHFAAEFTFETDCWDVHDALGKGADFILLDVRSPALFAKGHMGGAINLPHGKIVGSKIAEWPGDTTFVTYCAGSHCNGAARGALRLAELGRPVKTMPAVLPDGGTRASTSLRSRPRDIRGLKTPPTQSSPGDATHEYVAISIRSRAD